MPLGPSMSVKLTPRVCLVERGGLVEVRRDQLVPHRGAGLVDQLGAAVRRLLPDPEERPGRVGRERHPALVGDVHRRRDHRPARARRRRGERVRVVDRQVGHPGGRLARVHLPGQPDHPLPPQRADRVAAEGRVRVDLPVPPEEAGVERPARLRVIGREVRPARRALRITVALTHDRPPRRVPARCRFSRQGGARLPPTTDRNRDRE